MKRLYLFIFLAILAFAGCQELSIEQPQLPMSSRFADKLTLYATWSDESDTKTVVQDNGVSVWWTTEERLNVFYGAGYAGLFTSMNTEPAASALFEGGLSEVPGGTNTEPDDYWAVYPYNENNTCDGTSVTMSVPSHQNASEGTFADKLFPAVAKSSSLENMRFYNICGGAAFTVSAANIRSVTFTGKGGESLAGTVRVSMDANERPYVKSVSDGESQVTVYAPSESGFFIPGQLYFAVLIPQVLENGVDISFRTSTQIGTYELNRSVTINRSRFGILEAKDQGLDYELMPIDRLAFPDEQFGDYIFTEFDLDHNGVLDDDERHAVTLIEVNTNNIPSVEGIEFFPNLQTLICNGVDGAGLLTKLDVSKNTALEILEFNNNQLTSLDLSKNTALKVIYGYNNELTSLDVSNCTALQELECRNNQLESLNVSNCTALTYLSCYNNALTSLDVSKNTALQALYCLNNSLSYLDVSKNTALINLQCQVNELSSIDVTNNTALRTLSCGVNPITSLDISNNTALLNLYCYRSQLSSLDVTNNTSLRVLQCYSNQLTSLDVSKNTALVNLQCYHNILDALDVSKNPELMYLYCWDNSQISSLDVSANTKLLELDCGITSISSLDLSHNPDLGFLYCNQTLISVLDVSENPKLYYLNLSGNGNLHTLYMSEGQTISSFYKPETTTVVRVKNFGRDAFPDATFADYVFNNFDTNGNGTISHYECNAVTAIDISSGSISSLAGVEYFPNLSTLKVLNVGLSTLDVSANAALTLLNCSGNSLTSLNVAANPALKELYCSSNSLSALDVTNNAALQSLDVRSNPVTSLDLTHNGQLQSLWCKGNQFEELDLSANVLLKSLYCKDSPLLTTVWVAKGHIFTTLEKDGSTNVKEKSSGNGGGAEGFNQNEEGRWDN